MNMICKKKKDLIQLKNTVRKKLLLNNKVGQLVLHVVCKREEVCVDWWGQGSCLCV